MPGPPDLDGVSKLTHPRLAPLDPDRFLAWTWGTSHGKGRPWTVAEWAQFLGLSYDAARYDLVRQAAWTRREQRLGRYTPTRALLSELEAHGDTLAEIPPRNPSDHARWLRNRPASFWPQLRRRRGPWVKLPTVEEWAAELAREKP